MLALMRILHFLTLATVVTARVKCTVKSANGLLGKDSGIAVLVAFKYDITVEEGTNETDVESLLPDVEAAFLETVAPLIIIFCASAGTNITGYSNIVGMDTFPADYIVSTDNGGCGGSDCYTIHSEIALYVESTAVDAKSAFLLAIANQIETGSFDPSTINSAITIVSVNNFEDATIDSSHAPSTAPSSMSLAPSIAPSSMTSANSTTTTTIENILEQARTFATTQIQNLQNLQKDNPIFLYALIGGVLAIFLLLVCCCCSGRSRKPEKRERSSSKRRRRSSSSRRPQRRR